MKAIGWIFIVIGGLALIGSIAGGNSAFGPLFWLGLGIALVSIANRKNNAKEETKEEKKE
jgi:4-hydroxybenzoate polyprenyltransferase